MAFFYFSFLVDTDTTGLCVQAQLWFLGRYNEYNIRLTFFTNYLHVDVRSTSGLKHYFYYYFKQYEEQCVLLLQQLIREKKKLHSKHIFKHLKCHCHVTSSP